MSAPALKRRLGFGLLTLYGVGVMVGAGIYVLIGAVAGEAGGWAPLAFIIAGVIAAPTALSYAELSARIPQSAGEAAYILKAGGPPVAAAGLGLIVALIGTISSAAVLNGGVGYLQGLVDLPGPVLVALLGGALGAVAIWGVVESLAFAAILTLIEVIGLVIVVGAGASVEVPAVSVSPEALAPALGAGALLAFFAFIGFEDMVNMAEETKDPGRTMPRAIVAALAITTLLYVAVVWAALRAAPADTLAASPRPLAEAYEAATGGSAGFLSLIAVSAALNGVLAQIVMAARVLYGLGRFSPTFGVFHRAHPRFGTPVLATALAAGLAIALALAAPVGTLAEATSTLLLIVFIVINGALIALRRRGGDSPFRAPGFAPWLGVALSSAALIGSFL